MTPRIEDPRAYTAAGARHSLRLGVSRPQSLGLLAVLRPRMGQRLGIGFPDAARRAEFVLAEVVRISNGANFMLWMSYRSAISSTSMQTPLWSLSSAPSSERTD